MLIMWGKPIKLRVSRPALYPACVHARVGPVHAPAENHQHDRRSRRHARGASITNRHLLRTFERSRPSVYVKLLKTVGTRESSLSSTHSAVPPCTRRRRRERSARRRAYASGGQRATAHDRDRLIHDRLSPTWRVAPSHAHLPPRPPRYALRLRDHCGPLVPCLYGAVGSAPPWSSGIGTTPGLINLPSFLPSFLISITPVYIRTLMCCRCTGSPQVVSSSPRSRENTLASKPRTTPLPPCQLLAGARTQEGCERAAESGAAGRRVRGAQQTRARRRSRRT
jgi:hypothetical protein